MKTIIRGPMSFTLILLFSFLAVCPTVARGDDCGTPSGDIKFTVTALHAFKSRGNQNSCLFVNGPYFRTSNGVTLGDLTPGQPCTFYAADDNRLSPYGFWEAVIRPACLRFPLIEGLAKFKTFDLVRPTNQVNITIDENSGGFLKIDVSVSGGAPKKQGGAGFSAIAGDTMNALGESKAPSPREVSVKSWLGESKDPTGRPDSDMFRIVGNAGDSVTVRLDPDTRGGNNGGHATLRFVGPPAQQVTDALTVEHPQTITVQLDSTRSYDIAVEQEGLGDERYKGGYILTVESAQGKLYKLAPFDSVEK